MPKIDVRYLKKRSGWWSFHKRIPGTAKTYVKSLKTKDLQTAQQRRDKHLADREWEVEHLDHMQRRKAYREQYLTTVDDMERDYLREQIADEATDIADELGVRDFYWSEGRKFDPSRASEEELKPLKFFRQSIGEETPIHLFKEDWLKQLSTKNLRYDYNRGITILLRKFTVVEEVNSHDKAKDFLHWAATVENVSAGTIKKWKSGYVNFWEYVRKDPSVWKGHKFNKDMIKKNKIRKLPYSTEEVLLIHDDLSRRNSPTYQSLKDAVWIAAFTGSRLGAIAALEYNKENQTITFPAAKKEESSRTIPAHPEIKEALERWCSEIKEVRTRRKSSTISTTFSKYKKELGFTKEKDFHSFRRTFLDMCKNNNIPEVYAADIVGHKIKTISYGLYAGGTNIEVLRKEINKIDYRNPTWLPDRPHNNTASSY